jgi:predicted esterase
MWRADADGNNPDLAFFDALLAALQEQNLPTERVHLIGMSQGAAFAQVIAAQRAEYIGSLTAHSGWLPNDLPNPNGGFPVLLIHGAKDEQVPFEQAEAAHDHYFQLGHDVELVKDPERGHVWSPLANAKITLLLQRAANLDSRD